MLILASTALAQDHIFKIGFKSEGILYYGVLITYEGSEWLMRLKYYDSSCDCYHIVQENMSVSTFGDGYKLKGYNVKDGISNRRLTNDEYAADNFYFYIDAYGTTHLTNIDNQLLIGEVTVTEVKAKEITSALKMVNWRL